MKGKFSLLSQPDAVNTCVRMTIINMSVCACMYICVCGCTPVYMHKQRFILTINVSLNRKLGLKYNDVRNYSSRSITNIIKYTYSINIATNRHGNFSHLHPLVTFFTWTEFGYRYLHSQHP